MKKNVLLLSMIFATGLLNAQITVTEANIAIPTDVIMQSNDTMPSVAVPTSGANQTWDYSTGLVEHTIDTLSMSNPGWLTQGSFFPTSNLAAVDQNGFEVYFINDASSFRMIGAAGDIFGTGMKQIYTNPADEFIRFPSNFNDSYTTNSVQIVSILGSDVGAPVDSILNKRYATKMRTIDGWGTITTPYGTFDALRTDEVSYKADSVWAYNFGIESLVQNNTDTVYTITFWSNDPTTGFPVMEFTHDNAGNVLSAQWLKSQPVTAIENIENESASIFPNPAVDYISVKSEGLEVASIEIFTLDGKMILTETINQSSSKVDIQSLNNGTYLYNLKNANGEIIANDKLVVLK